MAKVNYDKKELPRAGPMPKDQFKHEVRRD
jgi:hypothetical protein